MNKKLEISEQSYYLHLLDIVNRKREKSLKEKENLEKYKILKNENEVKTVSNVVEKMIKQEKTKELIFEKKQKEEKNRKMYLEEKNQHFFQVKKKIKEEDKDKLKDIKEKLQKIDSNLEMKRVHLFFFIYYIYYN